MSYERILAFDTDEPAFTLGVEVGVLHERLKNEALPLLATVHAANVEMVLRLAEEFRCSVASECDADGWLVVRYY